LEQLAHQKTILRIRYLCRW